MLVRSARRAGAVLLCVCVALACAARAEARPAAAAASWADQDIGSPAIAGDAVWNGSTAVTVTAGGADIWDSSDQFHFVYQAISGDVDVRARVDSLTQASTWSKAGVMIRASLAANSAHAFALASAAKGTAFQRRRQNGGTSTHTSGPYVAAPEWVRLVRSGTTVKAYVSRDGSQWTFVGQDTIQLGTTAYVGIAVTSHSSSAATTASLSQIALASSAPAGLPAGMSDGDIGSPAISGSAGYTGGSFSIHAGGSDIWGTSDQFHYVYEKVTGDVDVSVHIASLAYADRWSKAGVMIRETLNAGSAHGYALVSAGMGYAFQERPTTGGSSVNTSGGSGAAPGWLRLKRAGALLTAYRSTDGTNWTVIGSDSISMANTVYVGIAVTSHNASVATDAVADHFTVTQSQSNQPPSVTLTSPGANATFTAPASIALAASASDPENQLAKVEFYSGSTLLATDTAAPYTFSWSSVPAGTYSLSAVAYDAAGASTASTPVTVTVTTGSTSTAPSAVSFQASADNSSVSDYRIDVFAAGADPATAKPVATLDAGKPTPDSTGLITVQAASFFSALAPGNYQLTVTAIDSGGSGRSAPVTFTR
ncbi:MAG TPA: Ig-like domain-containing protein [Vicinamibacterales bacterium]|nr:Ig-like domain-containing protein [Vicinamibacterales bacterium]